MSNYLDELSYQYIKQLPFILRSRECNFKLMCLNRNRKVVFVELKKYIIKQDEKYIYTFLLSCILPDDLFILAIFDENNKVLPLSTIGNFNLSLKEVYFYANELHDLDWIYEGDFRKKDTFFKIYLENTIS